MRYLIVGLGNIGAEYSDTRHNIGFMVLDALATDLRVVFESARYGDVAKASLRGRTLFLLKPSTYMNLSGKAVSYWMQKEKIPLENIFVICDDIALPLGVVRIRKKGSDGGHNGLKNINETLGTADYTRLRFGVGADFARGGQVDYVLGSWSAEEYEKLPALIKHCVDAVKALPFAGVDNVMNQYNKK